MKTLKNSRSNQVIPPIDKIYALHTRQQHIRKLQESFMEHRQEALVAISNTIKSVYFPENYENGSGNQFSQDMLNEFALGSIEAVFGSDFKGMKGRKYPRIPNRDLLCMDRVTQIIGKRLEFTPGSEITAEFDVSGIEWFFLNNTTGFLPVAVLMEIALQPCGFLSAFLGTMLTIPEGDIFFRNLDGEATLVSPMDVRGKTLKTRAVLLSSIMSGSTVIQRFSFEVFCEQTVIYQGNSVFGYFSKESLASQAGMDNGQINLPLKPSKEEMHSERWIPVRLSTVLANGNRSVPVAMLRMVDEIWILPGEEGIAKAIFACRYIRPSDWYFANHFYMDPVMPGSLGIEAIYQSLIAALYIHFEQLGFNQVVITPNIGQPLCWKYRGQVLPETKQMMVEIQKINVNIEGDGQYHSSAEASLWSDNTRVYEVKGISLRIQVNQGNL